MDKKYRDLGFSPDQAAEIEEGLKMKIDVSPYAKKEFLAIQMRQIRLGIMEGLPVELYARTDYDWFQMEEIRKGLLAKLDVSIYADPELPYDKMRQIRKGLKAGINLIDYKRFDAGILRELRKALLARINMVEYINGGYITEQLEQIRLALTAGVNIKPYINKELRGVSIREIFLGLEKGLDVSVYAKVEYSWQQMREIRLGMERRLDVTCYTNPLYEWQQMRQIRLGMEEDIDVSGYRSFMYTAREMEKKRVELLRARGRRPEPEQASSAESAAVEEAPFISSMKISRDAMEAYITVRPGVSDLSRETIICALAARGITFGLQEAAIEKIVRGEYTEEPVLIAKGKGPAKGKDGWYEYFFRREVAGTPKQLPDGNTDCRDIEWFERVEEGQKLACYHEAAYGEDGHTVTGKAIPGGKGRELSMLTGKGFILLPDKKTYLAAMAGKVDLVQQRMEVGPLLVVDDVTSVTGNINFEGSIYIRGNVERGTSVNATEDIIVDGLVEAAVIQCGGNILLRHGANSLGSGFIKAGKGIYGKFLEAVSVFAREDIRMNSCLNSRVFTEGSLHLIGDNGTLAGGEACAVRGVRTMYLGNRVGLHTEVKVGITDETSRNQKETEEKIENVHRELSLLGGAYMDLKKKYSPEVRNTMKIYLKLENAIYTKERELEDLYSLKKHVDEDIENSKKVCIYVGGTVFEGTVVEINGKKWQPQTLDKVTIKSVGGRIAAHANTQ